MKKLLMITAVAAGLWALPSRAAELTGEIDLGAEGAVLSYADGITGSATISNSSSSTKTLTIDVPENVEASFTGKITGNIKIVKTGAGLQKFASGNEYTGGTDILGGIMSISGRSCLGDGQFGNDKGKVTADGATLLINGESGDFGMTKYRIAIKNRGVIDVVEGATFGIESTDVLRTAGETFIKRGKGTLYIGRNYTTELNGDGLFSANISGATWIIEEGVFDTHGARRPFGENAAISGLTIQLEKGATMKTKYYCPLPNMVMNGGTLQCDHQALDVPSISLNQPRLSVSQTNTPVNIVSINTNGAWVIGNILVKKSDDGAPCVLKVPSAKMPKSASTVIDVEEGMELHLDLQLNSSDVNDAESVGYFVKKGKGTIRLMKPCDFKGEMRVEDGEIVLTKNTFLGRDVRVTSSGNGRVRLEDGSHLNVGNARDDYALVAGADVWLDATKIAGDEIGTVRNRGIAGGEFEAVSQVRQKGAALPGLPTVVANGINGKKVLCFDGTQAMVLNHYTNKTDNLTVFIVKQWQSWGASGGQGKWGSPISFSTVDATGDDNSTSGALTYMRNGDDISQFTVVFADGAGQGKRGSLQTGLEVGDPTIVMTVSTNAKAHVWSYLNETDAAKTMSWNSIKPFNIDLVAIGGRLSAGGSVQYGSSNSETDRMFIGYIGELIVFTRALSADEISTVQAYLRNKWFNASAEMVLSEKTTAQINVSVPQDAKAAVEVGDWTVDGVDVDKTGSGTLQFANQMERAVNVDVREGGILLSDNPVGVQADLWMDAADPEAVTLDDQHVRVVSVRNKGRTGGMFAQGPQEKTTVPCPLYSADGINGLGCLDFNFDSALTTMAYTNKVGGEISTFTRFSTKRTWSP